MSEDRAENATYPRAVADGKSSPMQEAFGRLNEGLERIDNQISRLRERLGPISHGASAVVTAPKEDESSSEHVAEIRGYARKANQLADEIAAVIDVLDV